MKPPEITSKLPGSRRKVQTQRHSRLVAGTTGRKNNEPDSYGQVWKTAMRHTREEACRAVYAQRGSLACPPVRVYAWLYVFLHERMCVRVCYGFICFGICRRKRLYGNTRKHLTLGNGLGKAGSGKEISLSLYMSVLSESFTSM